MKQNKPIFIIGHPGAGKALLAKTLANQIGWDLINADLGMEFKLGRQLRDIVGVEGEQALLKCQLDMLNYTTNAQKLSIDKKSPTGFKNKTESANLMPGSMSWDGHYDE